MSATNERRHGSDLPIRDKDLTTGRDVRRLVAERFEREWPRVEQCVAAAIEGERQRIREVERARKAAVWYRRLLARATKRRREQRTP